MISAEIKGHSLTQMKEGSCILRDTDIDKGSSQRQGLIKSLPAQISVSPTHNSDKALLPQFCPSLGQNPESVFGLRDQNDSLCYLVVLTQNGDIHIYSDFRHTTTLRVFANVSAVT